MEKPKYLIDAKEDQCREIIGHPKNGIICGEKVKHGSSYCTIHHNENYVKQQNKRLK